MDELEYCELWWSTRGTPLLTYYGPGGSQTFQLMADKKPGAEGWDTLAGAVDELGRTGWELLSASGQGAGLLFKRALQ